MSDRTAVAPAGLRPGSRWENWGRVETVRPVFIAKPTSVDEVVAAVLAARERGLAVKAIGASHSFTAIAAAPGVMLDLDGLDGLIEADLARGRVRLAAGTNLHQLPAILGPLGLALQNMGDIDRSEERR